MSPNKLKESTEEKSDLHSDNKERAVIWKNDGSNDLDNR